MTPRSSTSEPESVPVRGAAQTASTLFAHRTIPYARPPSDYDNISEVTD
jgi:hypothetical protein